VEVADFMKDIKDKGVFTIAAGHALANIA